MLAEEDKNAEEKSPLDGRCLCWPFSSCATGVTAVTFSSRARRPLPHAPGTDPASESPFLSRGSRRLQVAEEQIWDTPERPGMGTCPRGRCPGPAEGGRGVVSAGL